MKSPVFRDHQTFSSWLFFFYKVPSKPVNSRMKIWRKLNKAGAVQFKGSAYLLPYSEDHYEFFDWLVSEVSAMGGEAGLIKTDGVENMKTNDLHDLFNHHRASEYEKLGEPLQNLKIKINSLQKGTKLKDIGTLKSQFDKLLKGYEETQKLDFFASEKGDILFEQIQNLRSEFIQIYQNDNKAIQTSIARLKSSDYQGKIWITRPNPFVDRMATAWLIKKFIDVNAEFQFFDGEYTDAIENNKIRYDVRDGEFTHVGDMCTFEVLIKTFGLENKIIQKIAEIVHGLDVKDDKYLTAEAKGLEDILLGIRKSGKNDEDKLKKGMHIFEMLYAAFV